MAGEFILHQLFSEIEKEYKFIQERPYKVLEKLPTDTPLREAELRLKALREEQNSLVREMTWKHRGNGSEGNSTGGIIRGAQGKKKLKRNSSLEMLWINIHWRLSWCIHLVVSYPVEHLDSLIRTHARLMKDRRCGSFLWSLLPTRFTPVSRSNYSKLTSSLTLLSLNSLALTSQLRS